MICEFCKQEIKTDAQYIKDLWFHNDCILRAVVENQQLKEDIKGYEQERQKIYNSIPFKENQQLKELINGIREERDYLFNKLSFEIQQLKDRIDKALRKIENMFDLGNEETVIDDLLELEKTLKGEK